MKKIFFVLFISFAIISCKSSSDLKGIYQTISSDSKVYHFDMKNKKYNIEVKNEIEREGKFKTVKLSSKKTLIICSEMILKKTNGFIKELDKNGDSIVVGVYDGYKNLGATLFEITKDVNGSLSFRKTYVNEIKNTEIEGKLVQEY
jgi:hypothetical protein